MKLADKMNRRLFYSSLLYLCGLLLFLEWIYSVNQVTDTGSISIFIFYTLFCFFITFIRVSTITSFFLKGFGLLIVLNKLFIHPVFLGKRWWAEWYSELSVNLHLLLNLETYELTPFFRSLLFLLFIWLMSYLVYHWFVIIKRFFIFILLTFVYLTVLDTFTLYDATIPVIRTFVVSLLAFGIANYTKEVTGRFLHPPFWLLSLLSVILLAVFIGYFSPKLEPQWADPVPYLKQATGQDGLSSTMNKKAGYREDDTELGGPFDQDDTPIFHVTTDEKQYWRMETKDVYTGKGWVRSGQPDYEEQQHGEITFRTFSKAIEGRESKASMTFLGNTFINKLVYPYGVNQVFTEEEQVQFLLDNKTESIYTEVDQQEVSLSRYRMTYESPVFSVESMQNIKKPDEESIRAQYTQLPPDLPERIGELAEEITSRSMNRYDKVVEIERYFAESGYTYQISNVPIPGEAQDYVDQFLFDSKVGYCDNYSTAMVVMLRTLDIPARWVKGFTGGEKIGETEDENDSTNIYEVKNVNAHSWVEVYFPETGWVPFEPTQGFTNLTDFHVDMEEDELVMEEEDEPEEIAEQAEPEMPALEEDEQAGTEKSEADGQKVKPWLVIMLIIVFTLLLVASYIWRHRIKTFYLFVRFKRQYSAHTFEQAYLHILTTLEKQGIRKKGDQTLREYAEQVDHLYNTNKMGRLTSFYEQIIYTNNELSEKNKQELIMLWQELITEIDH